MTSIATENLTDSLMPTTSISGPTLPPLSSTTKRIFWIRHGEVINPGGDKDVYYGSMDVPLSDLGKEEAKIAGMYLQQYPLKHVFSSELSRAIYGAEQVIALQKQQNNDIKLVQLKGFKELDRGSWCGLTIEEIGKENLKRFDACDESITPDGGESYPALKERVLEARDIALSQMSLGTAAAVVSHLQVTRSIVSDALSIPTKEMVKQVAIKTASITCIDYEYDNDINLIKQTLHFQSFKPDVGLQQAKDTAN